MLDAVTTSLPFAGALTGTPIVVGNGRGRATGLATPSVDTEEAVACQSETGNETGPAADG